MQRVYFFVLLFLAVWSQTLFGQKKDRDSLVIDIFSMNNNYPAIIDSLVIYDMNTNSIYIAVKNASLINQSFKIPCPSGLYKITLSADGYKFSEKVIAICSLCENKIGITCFQKTERDAILHGLYLPPHYIGNIKADFQQSLSKKELARLQRLDNFKISFIITKDFHLSGVEFYTNQLNAEDKEIIKRALNTLKKWSHGVVNGNSNSDNYYSIESKQVLF